MSSVVDGAFSARDLRDLGASGVLQTVQGAELVIQLEAEAVLLTGPRGRTVRAAAV